MIQLSTAIWIFAGIVNILLIFKLIWDWIAKNIQHRIISHVWSTWIDGIFYSAASSYLFNYYLELSNWLVLGFFISAVAYRWFMFDLLFNLLNKKPIDYYGTSSFLDLQLSKLGRWHWIPKILLMITGLVLIYLNL